MGDLTDRMNAKMDYDLEHYFGWSYFDVFVVVIVIELDCEDEDGMILVYCMLDQVVERVVEMGCEGIELPKPVVL